MKSEHSSWVSYHYLKTHERNFQKQQLMAGAFFRDKNDNPLPQAGRWIFQFGKNVESPNEASLFELPNACGIEVCCPTNTFFRIHIDTNFDDFNQRTTHGMRNELYLSNEMALDGTRVASMISAMKRNFHNIASKKAI